MPAPVEPPASPQSGFFRLPVSMVRRVRDALGAMSPGSVGVLALLLDVVIGCADFLTGPEISSSLFYIGPVALAAWYAGPTWGIAMCLLGAGTWFAADVAVGTHYSAAWIPVWNALVRLLVFIVVYELLRRLKGTIQQLRDLSETDAGTGLANARRFSQEVEGAVALAARYGVSFSLVYLDLDGFKAVNDTWGHAAGDRVLWEVGEVLSEQFRETDLAARLGGDEFAALLPETNAAQAETAVAKVRDALEVKMRAGDWTVGFSIGVVTVAGGRHSAQDVVRNADELMYQVKRAGKGKTAFRTVADTAG